MIFLDTHTLIWWATGDATLSLRAKTVIDQEQAIEGDIIVSSITAWEIAMLVAKGRLMLTVDVKTWIEAVADIDQVRFLPVDNDIAMQSVHLPGEFHSDPADRIIVATARKLGAILVTKDEKITHYQHALTVW